jgi:hypothetical protein
VQVNIFAERIKKNLPEKNAFSYMAVPPMTAASIIPFNFMLSGLRATGELLKCS